MAKLSNYSVLKDSEWSCDYAEKQRQKIRSDYSLYFETTPVGHICLFAGGTLLRCEGYAEFTDSTGKKRYYSDGKIRNPHERSRFFPGIAAAMADQWG